MSEQAGMTNKPAENRGDAIQRMEWIVLATLAAVQFTSIVDFMVIMPLGPQLMRELEILPAQVGLIVSSYTFAAGAAGLVASSLVDRFSRRTSFLLVYSGFLVGTLLCGIAPTYETLVAARIATGMFGGVLGGIALAIIGDVFPEERRGRATGALMSAFSLASVAGVPFGLYLGTHFGWHAPFLALVVFGFPMLIVGAVAMPPLRGHLGKPMGHPLRSLITTFSTPAHWNAFALIATLMLGGFAVIPYISPFLVANVGLTEAQLPLVYIAGGGATLFTSPLLGWLADRHGKLRIYRIVAPLSAIGMLLITVVPHGGLVMAFVVFAGLMVFNSGRMVAAMAMVTGSVAPERRGGFMSANSSMQHLSAGVGAYLGGLIVTKASDGTLQHFSTVGLVAAATTLASIWLAGRLRPVDGGEAAVETTAMGNLGAVAEATCDVGEPLARGESL